MLFHDKRSGNVVAIEHKDLLPNDMAMAKYRSVAGQQGENDVQGNSQGGYGMEQGTDPSKEYPQVSNMAHQAIQSIHAELSQRAASENVKNELRAEKMGNN
jgi:hypothetical protein